MFPGPGEPSAGGGELAPAAKGTLAPGGPGRTVGPAVTPSSTTSSRTAEGHPAPPEDDPALPDDHPAPPEGYVARIVIDRADGSSDVMWLRWEGTLDITAVDALARLQLVCRRAGDRLRLEEVSAALAELLELSGLRREFEWQPEGREEPLRFQKGMDTGDSVS
jgi:hypothetical protein